MQSQYTPTFVDRVCETCQQTFQIRAKILTYGPSRGRFCGAVCRDAANVRDVMGRFEAFIRRTESGCWLWIGSTNGRGYGLFFGPPKTYAHRWAYRRFVGPIPEGMDLDHLCRTTLCVNPGHLEPVPHRVNVLRGMSPSAIRVRAEVCKRGHPSTPENVYTVQKTGGRQCRVCRRELRAADRNV